MYRRPCANKKNVKHEGLAVSVETMNIQTSRFGVFVTFGIAVSSFLKRRSVVSSEKQLSTADISV